MGRYYYGDIEGKFWFAVQSSSSPLRFKPFDYYYGEVIGSCYFERGAICFDFMEEDLQSVKEELEKIEAFLGEQLEKIRKYFEEHPYYQKEHLFEYLGVNDHELGNKYLSEYADYNLGVKIKNCLEEKGYCYFEGEL